MFPKNHCPIKVIQEDALKFRDIAKYDFAFVDLWHDPNDGLPLYIQIKHIEAQFPNCEFCYWLEPSLLSLYRRCYLTVVEESLNGFTDKDYQQEEVFTDRVINGIYFQTKNLVINSYEDLLEQISDIKLKELILKTC